MREPLELTLQECCDWIAATAALINERLRRFGQVRVRHMPDQYSDDGLLAELATLMRRDLFALVQALPAGFELLVMPDEATIRWVHVETGRLICIEDVMATRPM